jgi:hypothetical protein
MTPDFQKSNASSKRNTNGGGKRSLIDTSVTDSRCTVCSHKQRKVIDKFLARGTAYADLERAFGIGAQSIRRHDINHLSLKNSAIRTIIRRETEEGNVNIEEGIAKIIKRKVYLEAALDKALDAILDGDVTVEPRDAVAIIEKLDDFENRTSEAQMIQMKIEFHATMQAIKERVPEEYWDGIAERTRELVERSEVKSLTK